MNADKIKETLSVFRVYLIILFASGITTVAWFLKNINTLHQIIQCVTVVFTIFMFVMSSAVEIKIKKLINLL